MDQVKNSLAVACLAYERGDVEFAIKSFMQGMDTAVACGDLKQVIEFLQPPVAQLVTNVPTSENTMAPALHSDDAQSEHADPVVEPVAETQLQKQPETQPVLDGGIKPIDIAKPVDPQPVVAPVTEPVPSTITSISGAAMVDEGDEELEARAEAEDEIEDDEDLDDEDDEDDEESDDEDEEEEGMQLSISSSTPLRLKG